MQQLVEQIISQLTGNALMFTAYDITMMLRRANPTTNIKHGEVRDAVHQLFTNNQITGYVRNLQNIAGKDSYVYHPYGTDAEDYDANFFSTTTPQSLSIPNYMSPTTQAVANPAIPTQMTTSSLGSGMSLGLKPKRARYSNNSVPQDKFGRVRIPACILRDAGFKPKDSVKVTLDSNVLVITSENDPYGKLFGKRYVVDQYNNIRIHLKGQWTNQSLSMQVTGPQRVFARPV